MRNSQNSYTETEMPALLEQPEPEVIDADDDPKFAMQLIDYGVSEAVVAAKKKEYASLVATTPEGYKACRLALREIVGTRTMIEKKRVAYKADALDYGRRIDSEAKRATAMLLEIEDPLKAKVKAIDDAEAAKKRAAEEAARLAREAKEKAQRDAEAAKLKKEHEEAQADIDRQKAELAAMRKRLADEQAQAAREAAERQRKIDEQRDAEAKAERARQSDAQAKIDEANWVERERLDRVAAEQKRKQEELDRIAAEQQKAVEEAAAKERQRLAAVEAENAAKEQAIRDVQIAEEAAKRAEALKPEREKLKSYAAAIRAVEVPTLASEEAGAVLEYARGNISEALMVMDDFAGK